MQTDGEDGDTRDRLGRCRMAFWSEVKVWVRERGQVMKKVLLKGDAP